MKEQEGKNFTGNMKGPVFNTMFALLSSQVQARVPREPSLVSSLLLLHIRDFPIAPFFIFAQPIVLSAGAGEAHCFRYLSTKTRVVSFTPRFVLFVSGEARSD